MSNEPPPSPPPSLPASLIIRAATVADRGPAQRLLSAALVEAGLVVGEDAVARAVELSLARESSAWLVLALSHAMPAGVLLANPCVSVEHGGAALAIDEVYVQPSSRRRGIGRALVGYVAAEARLNGMSAVLLEAKAAGEAGPSLCRALGFHPVERRRFSLPL